MGMILKPTVYGWGINDLRLQDIVCPELKKDHKTIYQSWQGMIKRFSCEKYKAKYPSYEFSGASDEWKFLSTFKVWCMSQPWKGLELDKDILVPGNKFYSPETCAFVPKYVNYCFLIKQGGRGEYPIGVSKRVEKRYGPDYQVPHPFRAEVNDGTGTVIRLGIFDEPMDAHRAWQLAKVDVIENTVLRYMLEPSYRQDVANAIYLRAEMLRDDYENNRETFSL